MDDEYDEDLWGGMFLSWLRNEHRAVLSQAAAGGWLVCVPCALAAPAPPLPFEVVETHMLVPCPCPGERQLAFTTLGGHKVTLLGGLMQVRGGGTARVLFRETFYEGEGRYTVACLDQPLTLHPTPLGQPPLTPRTGPTTLRECVEMLQSRGEALGKVEALATTFLAAHSGLEGQDMADVAGAVQGLYSAALQQLGGEDDPVIRVAVEGCLLHHLHGRLLRCLASCQPHQDAHFNRALRTLCDMQPSDLGLDSGIAGGLVRATRELASLGSHTTPMGKLGCLRRAITQLGAESSDQLLPGLVLAVVRANLPTWPAQLAFLRLFHFAEPGAGGGEEDFQLSSLEAALQHIASGANLRPVSPEGECVLQPLAQPAMTALRDPCTHYFECVCRGMVEEVQALLEGQGQPRQQEEEEASAGEDSVRLCHPLCRCSHCDALTHQSQQETWPTVASEDPQGRTGLHLACLYGRPAIVELLVSRGAALEAKDHSGAAPLHHAAQRGHQNALLLLLHSGANTNTRDSDQNTALHLSALQGHTACIKAMLFYTESVGQHLELDAQNTALDTPLHLAARWGHLVIVELLLDRMLTQAQPLNLANRRHLTPLKCAHNILIEQAILQAQAKATPHKTSPITSPSPTTQLTGPVEGRQGLDRDQGVMVDKMLKAVRVGDTHLVCYYLGIEHGAVTTDNTTITDTATTIDTTTTDTTTTDTTTTDTTTYNSTTTTDNTTTVTTITTNMIKTNITTTPSPAHKISSPPSSSGGVASPGTPTLCHPLCQCVQCMLVAPAGWTGARAGVRGLGVNACDAGGHTALHEAVRGGYGELARLLLLHGANVNAQTIDQGRTPLHLAAQVGDGQLVADLAGHGATLDLPDTLGNTALHLSCARGYGHTTTTLLRLGATATTPNRAGNTPAEEAELHGHWALVQLVMARTHS